MIEGSGRSRCEAENARWGERGVVQPKSVRWTVPSTPSNSPNTPSATWQRRCGGSTARFDLTRLVPSLLAAAAASKPWSERALRDVTMFTAESAC
ncbi:transposase [Xanthomonas oryzae pv. oryzae KACC 10331]|uniref:Transposase n=1 Tax=Xanthomonas oryzae pv. oryzae (strain KACC10331 / KXO85) TaxID=291331 RepID=Q05I71_XANOR|nr:transposase [Xanthomonas oryzae pv. oryzae KACC 10331]